MMKFYVSWYPGDPYYPFYDSDCSLLVSISSISREWNIKHFPKLPHHLMVDSGGYRYAMKSKGEYLPKKSFERQLAIISDTGIPSIICALDYPLINVGPDSNEKDRNIHQTIALAYELKNLIIQKNLSTNIIPMGIIQGDSPETVHHCAYELRAIGFPVYGLGSMAFLNSHRLILERVKAVISIIGVEKLHIFGISAVKTVLSLRNMGIHSIDSAKAAKAAAYNEIFYSHPFRRFGILEEQGEVKGKIPVSRRLTEPLPCDCPACLEDPWQILGVGKRKNIRSRALHNYYHLKRTFFS